MNEAGVTRYWKLFLESNQPKDTECYELKLVNLEKTKSFAFDRVADHQVDALLASLEGFWYKIVDSAAINGFSAKKPFDAIWIKAKEAYVVVIFYLPRRYKKALLIPVKDFVKIRDRWERKSIRMDELEQQSGVSAILLH